MKVTVLFRMEGTAIENGITIKLDTNFATNFMYSLIGLEISKVKIINFTRGTVKISRNISFIDADDCGIMLFDNTPMFCVRKFSNVITFAYMLNDTFTNCGLCLLRFYQANDGFGTDRMRIYNKYFARCPIFIDSKHINRTEIHIIELKLHPKYISSDIFSNNYKFGLLYIRCGEMGSVDLFHKVDILSISSTKLKNIIILNAKVIVLRNCMNISRIPPEKNGGFLFGDNNFVSECVLINLMTGEVHLPIQLSYYYYDLFLVKNNNFPAKTRFSDNIYFPTNNYKLIIH